MNAQQRSESEAMRIAQEFLGKKGKTPRLSVVSNQKVNARICNRTAGARRTPAKNQGFYVVNDEANNRFVIVSADERFYKILGYSNNGTFNPETAPPGLLDLLEGYNAQYDYLLEHAPTTVRQNQRKVDFPVVEPLIKSKWGQSAPYWNWCPYDYDKNDSHPCVTGCVATALAQVMNYYKYPERGQGSFSYTTPFGTELAIDFDSVRFNWDKIQDTYIYYYDDEGEHQRVPERSKDENDEVAKLMKACGISVAMKYGTGSSGANSQDLVAALVKYFNYNPNILFKRKDDYSVEDWDSLIVHDLLAGHPILYSGNQGWSGHQFILDGCNANGMYHFNFGWCGSDDGYYMLSGTDGIDYNWGHTIVFQVTPELYGVHEDYCATKFEIKKRNIAVGENSEIILCVDYARPNVTTEAIPFSGEVGLALFDMDYNFIDTLFTKEVCSESSNISIWGVNVRFDKSLLKNGNRYVLAPYSKAIDAQEPILIRTKDGKQSYYIAKVTNDSIAICPQGVEIPEVAGIYKVSATDASGQNKEWYIRIELRDGTSDYEYSMCGIDPALAEEPMERMPSVSGTLSYDGKNVKLSKFVSWSHGRLINYSNEKSDLILKVDHQLNQLVIEDEWGTITEGDSTELSRYTNTKFTPVSAADLAISVADNEAGMLYSRLPSERKYFITSLSVTGLIDGSDIKLLRELLKVGSLNTLDLHDAIIVEGGEPYLYDNRTQSNIIGEYMFYNCDNLSTLFLPSQVTTIQSSSVNYCDNLSYLVIPTCVEIINDYCLSSCKSLRRIDSYIRNIEKVKSSNSSYYRPGDLKAFEDVPEDCEWHVVKGLRQKYMSQSWWKDSWTIVDDLISSVIKGDVNDDGEVDVADVTSIIGYIMLQPLGSVNVDASDMDDDGEVDVADLTLLISSIMLPDAASSRIAVRKPNDITETVVMDMIRLEKGCALQLVCPENYVSSQFDVVVPHGVTVESVKLNNANNHQVVVERMGECRYRVLVFSMFNTPFERGEADWLTICLSGGNVLSIENAMLTSSAFGKQKAFVMEGVTSVNRPKQDVTTSPFLLDGRRVNGGTKLPKGIYIINGKKCVVR